VELLGGTPSANARASQDSYPKISEFLAKALRKGLPDGFGMKKLNALF
jgi:hypothetical protein